MIYEIFGSHAHDIFDPPIGKITVFYKSDLDSYEPNDSVTWVHGFDASKLPTEREDEPHMIIFDDVVSQIPEDLLLEIYTIKNHHLNWVTVTVLHNLFFRGIRQMRLLSLNVQIFTVCFNWIKRQTLFI